MSKRTEIKLKKHLTAHARKYYPLLLILYVGILSILIFPISFSENAMACFGGYIACPVICIFLTRTVWSAHKTLKQNFTALAESGKLEAVLEDFAKSERAMGKNLCIGKLGLYGKGSNRVVLYSEMDTIYSMISDRRGQNPRDLKFIDSLPGKKIIGKGNHDYWWSTVTKMNAFFKENGITTIDFLFNNAHETEDYIIAGTRGWYVEEKLQATKFDTDYDKIVSREVSRLRTSLEAGKKMADGRELLVFFHFPPVFRGFICREIVDVLHEYGVKNCYFGHIHGLYSIPRSQEFEGIRMTMISADSLDFTPMIVMPADY
jgi:predicted phosphohydrolase